MRTLFTQVLAVVFYFIGSMKHNERDSLFHFRKHSNSLLIHNLAEILILLS